MANNTFTATSSNEKIVNPISPPAHSLTELPALWKGLLDTSTLSLPDFDGKMKCADVICSNFVNSKCAQKISVRFENAGVIPKCHFQDGTSNIRVLLLSYPGSGNTWIRQLIERSSGVCTGKINDSTIIIIANITLSIVSYDTIYYYCTGSVYCDIPIFKSGMIGEGVNAPSVLVVKTHLATVSIKY